MLASKDGKTQILEEFHKILAEKKKADSRIATKEEEAEKEKNKQILDAASTYTIDSIVKGMANLQLEFGGIVNGLSERLTAEVTKLEELKRAIEVETQHLQELQRVRVVADALHILTQEHQETLKTLEQETASQRSGIEKDIAETRKAWKKEQQEYEAALQEETALLAKERQQEQADYQYKLERDRQIKADDYEASRHRIERESQEANQEKGQQWAERESILSKQQPLLEEYQKKAEALPQELDAEVKKVREEAIKEVHNDAKVKSDLFDKEWEATKQGYELKVQSLEATIQRETEQMADLTAQLQTAMKQAQALAMRAFESTSRGA